MYYAPGYDKSDFDKPMIGIANRHSIIARCNAGLQPLAAAAFAIKAAGANPQMFGTPVISDGMVQGQWMDGVLVLGGCDKNMAGGMFGIRRANARQSLSMAAPSNLDAGMGHDLSIV